MKTEYLIFGGAALLGLYLYMRRTKKEADPDMDLDSMAPADYAPIESADKAAALDEIHSDAISEARTPSGGSRQVALPNTNYPEVRDALERTQGEQIESDAPDPGVEEYGSDLSLSSALYGRNPGYGYDTAPNAGVVQSALRDVDGVDRPLWSILADKPAPPVETN